ncbi:hypothetical protein GCK72_022884 [Caenorhabditis remanei]|uniref:Uncharacterized protein n=1 Tax=Caenorhabditis remanei TaxID=31234 RepID=A0A6A5FVE2_CAERE|nr:hypothetical protein GCK72_022884 [Caenorhabditis remanei]KAF1746429.1 hypothetical protein GCK72_022884 [Caenorhabditis remanei]
MKVVILLLSLPIFVSSYYICGHFDPNSIKTLWNVGVGETLQITGGFFEQRNCYKLPKFITTANGTWYASPQEGEAQDYYLLVHNISNETTFNAGVGQKNTSIVSLDEDPIISLLNNTTVRTEILETETPETPELFEMPPIESDEEVDLLQELNLFVETPETTSPLETPATPKIQPSTTTKGRMAAVLLALIFVVVILIALGYYGCEKTKKKATSEKVHMGSVLQEKV